MKEKHFLGAVGIFSVLMLLTAGLFIFPIQESNQVIVQNIVSLLSGILTMVIYTIIGKSPDDLDNIKKENLNLLVRIEHLENENRELRDSIRALQTQIIDKLSHLADK